MTNLIQLVSYGRNSSDQQDTSQDIQHDEHLIFAHQIAPQLLGRQAEIIHTYIDDGVSGSKSKELPKRHDFHRMLADMANGKIGQTGQQFPKFVLVLNTSRFSRLHPVDTMGFYSTMRSHGVKLVSIHDRKIYDPDEFQDMLLAFIKAEQDRSYSRGLAYNILGGMKHANSKGSNTTSTVPVGMARLIVDNQGNEKIIPRKTKYRCGDDETSYLIPGDDVEQQIVNFIYDQFLQLEISYTALARLMNNHEDTSYRIGPNGNGWSQQTIMGMLQNHHLAGWEFIGKKRTSGHATLDNGIVTASDKVINPPDAILTDVTLPNVGHSKQGCVVDRDRFNRVQQLINGRKTNKRRCCNSEYPLTGILRCQCGEPLYAAKEKSGVVRYGCKRARQKLIEHNCGWWSVKQDDVLPAIMSLIDGEIWKASHEQPPTASQSQIDIHSKQIELINRKIDNLRDKIKSSDHDAIDILTDALTDAVKKRRHLIQQQPTFNPHHRQDIIDRWQALIEPLLIKTPTTKPSQTFNRIRNLFPDWTREQIRQLADEGDRFFNVADVHPSRVRQVLHDAGISVQFAFEALEPHQSGKKRRLWRVKEAKITMGSETFDLEQDKTCSAGPRERLTT